MAQQINLGTQVKGLLAPANAGTGTDTSTLSGCPKITGGVWSFTAANCASGPSFSGTGGITITNQAVNPVLLGLGAITPLSVALPTGSIVTWNGDTGLSRGGAGVLNLGNGNPGDTSGTLILSGLTANAPVTLQSTLAVNGAASFAGNANVGGLLSWGGVVGLSRLGTDQLGLGNGNAGDTSGLLVLGSLFSSGTVQSSTFQTLGNPNSSFQATPTGLATASANYPSNQMQWLASTWNGTTPITDQWYVQNVPGSGANPTSTLTFSHSGSTGAAAVILPGINTSQAGVFLGSGSGNVTVINGETVQGTLQVNGAATLNGGTLAGSYGGNPRFNGSPTFAVPAGVVTSLGLGNMSQVTGNTGSIASATAVTVYTFSTTSLPAMYLVSASLAFSTNSAAAYDAYAVIAVDGTGPRIMSQTNGSSMTITLSGLAVQLTQTSGATQSGAIATIIRIA